jgi:hypothetical protein
MKIASSTIKDLRAFVRRQGPLLSVNGGGGRLSFSRYGPLDLASSDQSWDFSHCRREECCPHNICPGRYVFDKGDSYPRLASDIDKIVRLLFLGILVWVLLPMVIDFLMATPVYVALVNGHFPNKYILVFVNNIW